MYKLLTHNDLDGVGCGILAKLAFGKDIKVRYNSIGGLDREVEWFLENEDKDTMLFITDLSVNEDNEKRLEEYYQNEGKVQLIDHHKTSLHYNDYDWAHVVVETSEGNLTSATSLFYQYLINQGVLEQSEALDDFVELVRQYDTWEWEKNGNLQAHRLNALFFLVTIEEFEEKMFERLKKEGPFYFDDFEKKILHMEEEKIKRYIHRKRRELVQAKIRDYYVGIVYAESYHSELGNELGKENHHLDYIAILNIGGKKVSFRTVHDHIDVSDIAAKLGGGGHAKASGCSMNEEAYKLYVTDTFHLEPLHEDARHNRYNLKDNSFGALYQNKKGDKFLLRPLNAHEWIIEKNRFKLDTSYPNFLEGEKFLKRNEAAWLAKDDVFVHYLMDEVNALK